MYNIDANTGKYPFLSNWNWYMQTEINIISAYIEENEYSHQAYVKNPLKSDRVKLFEGFNSSDIDIVKNIIGEDIEDLNRATIYKSYFSSIMRYSLFVMSISMFEVQLKKLCNSFYFDYLQSQKVGTFINESFGDFKNRVNNKGKKPGLIDLLKDYLKEICQFKYNDTIKKQWEILTCLYRIRNQMVHNFGEFKGKNEITLLNKYFINVHKNKLIREHLDNISLEYLQLDDGKNIVIQEAFLNENLIPFYRDFVMELSVCINNRIKSK